MKLLIVALLSFFVSFSTLANTVFECQTPQGLAQLEELNGVYTFSLGHTTCILTNRSVDPEVNRGQGYDSWELEVGNDAQLCSYVIEYVDVGEGEHYSVVKNDTVGPTRMACDNRSVVNNFFNTNQ